MGDRKSIDVLRALAFASMPKAARGRPCPIQEPGPNKSVSVAACVGKLDDKEEGELSSDDEIQPLPLSSALNGANSAERRDSCLASSCNGTVSQVGASPAWVSSQSTHVSIINKSRLLSAFNAQAPPLICLQQTAAANHCEAAGLSLEDNQIQVDSGEGLCATARVSHSGTQVFSLCATTTVAASKISILGQSFAQDKRRGIKPSTVSEGSQIQVSLPVVSFPPTRELCTIPPQSSFPISSTVVVSVTRATAAVGATSTGEIVLQAPAPSAGFPVSVVGVRKEAEAFLASLRIPLQNSPLCSGASEEKEGSLIIKFDEDSDSDGEHSQKPNSLGGHFISEKGFYVNSSGSQQSAAVSVNQPADLNVQINEVRKQIAAIERNKSKTVVPVAVGKSQKVTLVDSVRQVISSVVPESRASAGISLSTLRAGPADMESMESLRLKIAAKESELQVWRQRLAVNGSENSKAVVDSKGVTVGSTATTVVSSLPLSSKTQIYTSGIGTVGVSSTRPSSERAVLIQKRESQAAEGEVAPFLALASTSVTGAGSKGDTEGEVETSKKHDSQSKDNIHVPKVGYHSEDASGRHILSSSKRIRSEIEYPDSRKLPRLETPQISQNEHLVTGSHSSVTIQANHSLFGANDMDKLHQVQQLVQEKRKLDDSQSVGRSNVHGKKGTSLLLEKTEAKRPRNSLHTLSEMPETAEVLVQRPEDLNLLKFIHSNGVEGCINLTYPHIGGKASPVGCSISTSESPIGSPREGPRDERPATVKHTTEPAAISTVLAAHIVSTVTADGDFLREPGTYTSQSQHSRQHQLHDWLDRVGYAKQLMGEVNFFKNLEEEEEAVDIELEKAQENRRKCEIRERLARKEYREAQQALRTANLQCDLLQERKEMLLTQLHLAEAKHYAKRACIDIPSWSTPLEVGLHQSEIGPSPSLLMAPHPLAKVPDPVLGAKAGLARESLSEDNNCLSAGAYGHKTRSQGLIVMCDDIFGTGNVHNADRSGNLEKVPQEIIWEASCIDLPIVANEGNIGHYSLCGVTSMVPLSQAKDLTLDSHICSKTDSTFDEIHSARLSAAPTTRSEFEDSPADDVTVDINKEKQEKLFLQQTRQECATEVLSKSNYRIVNQQEVSKYVPDLEVNHISSMKNQSDIVQLHMQNDMKQATQDQELQNSPAQDEDLRVDNNFCLTGVAIPVESSEVYVQLAQADNVEKLWTTSNVQVTEVGCKDQDCSSLHQMKSKDNDTGVAPMTVRCASLYDHRAELCSTSKSQCSALLKPFITLASNISPRDSQRLDSMSGNSEGLEHNKHQVESLSPLLILSSQAQADHECEAASTTDGRGEHGELLSEVADKCSAAATADESNFLGGGNTDMDRITTCVLARRMSSVDEGALNMTRMSCQIDTVYQLDRSSDLGTIVEETFDSHPVEATLFPRHLPGPVSATSAQGGAPRQCQITSLTSHQQEPRIQNSRGPGSVVGIIAETFEKETTWNEEFVLSGKTLEDHPSRESHGKTFSINLEEQGKNEVCPGEMIIARVSGVLAQKSIIAEFERHEVVGLSQIVQKSMSEVENGSVEVLSNENLLPVNEVLFPLPEVPQGLTGSSCSSVGVQLQVLTAMSGDVPLEVVDCLSDAKNDEQGEISSGSVCLDFLSTANDDDGLRMSKTQSLDPPNEVDQGSIKEELTKSFLEKKDAAEHYSKSSFDGNVESLEKSSVNGTPVKSTGSEVELLRDALLLGHNWKGQHSGKIQPNFQEQQLQHPVGTVEISSANMLRPADLTQRTLESCELTQMLNKIQESDVVLVDLTALSHTSENLQEVKTVMIDTMLVNPHIAEPAPATEKQVFLQDGVEICNITCKGKDDNCFSVDQFIFSAVPIIIFNHVHSRAPENQGILVDSEVNKVADQVSVLGTLRSIPGPCKYESPLSVFRSYHKVFKVADAVGHFADSNSCSHAIDPFKPLCKFELQGKCHNEDCQWQHVDEYTPLAESCPQQQRDYATENPVVLSDRSPSNVLDSAFAENQGDYMVIREAMSVQNAAFVPIYHIGSYLIKAEDPDIKIPDSFSIQCTGKFDTFHSFLLSTSLHRPLPFDVPCLVDVSEMALSECSQASEMEAPDWQHGRDGKWRQRLTENHLLESPTDVESWLELAMDLIDHNINTDNAGARDEALYILSRALDANRTSQALWVVYVSLFHRRKGNTQNDDMFQYAVHHNKFSYELWLMYINSRSNLLARVEAYEAAIVALGGAPSHPDSDDIYHSAYMLDLALQMLYSMCVAERKNDAMSFIHDLARDTSTQIGAQPSRGSTFALLHRLTGHDACILWVCCTYLTSCGELPKSILMRLGCQQKLIFDLDWDKHTDRNEVSSIRILELMRIAASSGRGCLSLESESAEVLANEENQVPRQALAVNYLQCIAVHRGLDIAMTLGLRLMELYPHSLELVLVCARMKGHAEGPISGLHVFEQAVLQWGQDHLGMQQLWSQYAGHALLWGGKDSAHIVLQKCAKSAKNQYSVWSKSSTSTVDPCKGYSSSSDLTGTDGILSPADYNYIRESLLDLSSISKESRSYSAKSGKQFQSTDSVYALMNLALHEALCGNSVATKDAAHRALQAAVVDNDMRYCLLELAALFRMFSYKEVSLGSSSMYGKSIHSLLDSCNRQCQIVSRLLPLSNSFVHSLKKSSIRAFMKKLLGPSPIDHSLLNNVLETCFGLGLLPQEYLSMKDVFSFAEGILEFLPGNVEIALSLCNYIGEGWSSENSSSVAAAVWASSLLVDSLLQAYPVAPEKFWVKAGLLLAQLHQEKALEEFYLCALGNYPFSTALWRNYLAICKRYGNWVAASEAAKQRGLNLPEVDIVNH